VSGGVRVEVVVSPGCHLCDDACAVIKEVCGQLDVGWATRNLADLEPDEAVRWREYTPVTFVDGAVHDVFRVSPDRLRAALS
jgi:hypothetical protein